MNKMNKRHMTSGKSSEAFPFHFCHPLHSTIRDYYMEASFIVVVVLIWLHKMPQISLTLSGFV